ncbi:MAG: ABC transporter substrate-binding protein [Rhizobium sp.]
MAFSIAVFLGMAPMASAERSPENAALKVRLPQAVKDRGYLMVGNAAAVSPPWSYHPDNDAQKYDGFDVDLAKEFARRLGVGVKFESVAFATLIPGVQSGRYDIGMQGMADTPARQQVVDMVDYMFAGDGIVLPAANPKNIAKIEDLCGTKTAVVVGSSQAKLVEAQSAACAAPIAILQFPAVAEAYVSLRSGRADAYVYGYEISSYMKTSGAPQFEGLELLPDIMNMSIKAIAVRKDFPELRDLVRDMIQDMIVDGSYQELADKWGLGRNVVKAPDINNHLMKP